MTAVAALAALVAATSGPLLVAPARLEGAAARAQPWLAPALAELLPEALLRLGLEPVDPADARLAATRLALPAAVSRAATLRLMDQLGAPAAITTAAALQAGTLTLTARRLTRDSLGPPLEVSGPLPELGEVVAALAARLAPLEQPSAPPRRLPPLPPAAALDWARGLAGDDLEARRAALEGAVAAAGECPGPRFALARLLREQEQPALAAQVLSGVERPSQRRRALLLQAVALIEAGEARAAERLFDELIAERPGPAVLTGRAVALLRRDPGTPPPAAALDALERAQELAPASTEIRFDRAWAALRGGEAASAASAAGLLRELIEAQPQDVLARLVRVWALARAGESAARDAEWEALVSLAPGLAPHPEPDLSRPLERLLESEHPLEAGADPRSAAERAADAVGRAERLLVAGAAEAAWREASRAVYLDPHRVRAQLVLARALRARGESESALRALRMALWSRDDPAVRLELLLYLDELGMGAEAEAEARELLARDPEHEAARRRLGR